MSYIVYKHTSPSNKVYIGITSRKPEYRWREGKGYQNHPYFFNAILKYGWDNIKHEILHTNLTKEQAVLLERKYISIYKALGVSYNLTDGGEGVRGLKRKFSLEWRAKLSLAHKGLKHSISTRIKMSKSRLGKQQTSLWIQRRIQSHKRSIEAIKDETTLQFSSIQEASKALSIEQSNISAVCRGRRRSAGGYKFRYI